MLFFLDSINIGDISDAVDNPDILSRKVESDSEDNFQNAGNLLYK